jgi:hypothetical protein
MKQFKIRSSAVSQIMANIGLTDTQQKTLSELLSKDKRTEKQDETLKQLQHKKNNPVLPEGAKTYCEQWYKEQLYNRRKEIYSKYMDKGLTVEEMAIEYISSVKDWGLVLKNQQFFELEFITGTPDVILSDFVADVKCSWNCFSFPLTEDSPDNKYWWQLQAYMILTGKDKAKLIYALMDMPEHLLDKEFYYAAKSDGLIELDQDQEDDIRAMHTYSNLPSNLRIKEYTFEKDPTIEKQINDMVILCREYIQDLIKKFGPIQ